MTYLDIFRNGLEGHLSREDAKRRLQEEAMNLFRNGQSRDCARAELCLTYFSRYEQYDHQQISVKDLLLFMRDFVLFVGQFHWPRLITDAVRHDGAAFGLYLTSNEEVDVIEQYPKELNAYADTIHEIYHLDQGSENPRSISIGDSLIQKHTVFTNYRSLEQKTAVHCAVMLPDDYTLLVSLPTGGGKSLVTQILAASSGGLTLVIVPTVSLAKDQHLQARAALRDPAIAEQTYSFVGGEDNFPIVQAVKNQKACLVFTSPEALMKNQSLHDAVLTAAESHYLKNVVVDEAHIVPDWGVYFRPEFQLFSVMLNQLREKSGYSIRAYLLSATLSDDVVDVLRELYAHEDRLVQLRCDSLRVEPRYSFFSYHDFDLRQKKVLEMVKLLPKPMIVYVTEPKVANQYRKLMQQDGYKNIFTYTGETSDEDRIRVLEMWKEHAFDVIFATSAFGMGVDKNDVRTVIHGCAPENLSRFYQEVGRGGRDGLPSLSVMVNYTSPEDGRNDLDQAQGLTNKSILTVDKLVTRFRSMLHASQTIVEGDLVTADLDTVPTSFSREEAEHAGSRNMSWNANTLLLLHRQGYIKLVESVYDLQKNTYRMTFRLLDLQRLLDDNRLKASLQEDRQREYNMRMQGYYKIRDLVQAPRAKCWANHFVSLYPLSYPLCSGCPAHSEPRRGKDDLFKIRANCKLHMEAAAPSVILRRKMGPLLDLMLPWDHHQPPTVQRLMEVAERLDVGSVVYPDEIQEEFTPSSMALTYSEFEVLAQRVPWILNKGFILLMTESAETNDHLIHLVSRDELSGYRKIWCGRPDAYIPSRGKPLQEFLNCHQLALSSI